MFCKTVWNGLHILPDGHIRLCSISTNSDKSLDMQRARDSNGNLMHILTHDVKDIMNSDKHCQVRQYNVENPNGWSPHCSCCENREVITNFNRNHPNTSRRVYLLNIDSNNVVNEFNYADKLSEDGKIDWMPSSLDIRFGNLCNQKCIMCSPQFSNLWYEEYFEYNKTNTFGQVAEITVTRDPQTKKWIEPPELNWYEDPRWWPKFEQMMPYLKHIYITGGEPMVTPAHDVMLDKLIESGYAKNVWLEYDSNCSAINDKIANRWFHFKKVDIRGSMDAVGDQYELIRFGGKWEKFVKNIQKLKDYEKQSGGRIKLQSASTCFQTSTIFSIIESEEWCRSMGINFHLRFLEGPARHRVATLSKDAKEEIIDYYRQHLSSSQKASLIIKHLENHLDPKYENKDAQRDFITFMDYLDQKRGTDWKKVFPKVHNIVTKSIDNV